MAMAEVGPSCPHRALDQWAGLGLTCHNPAPSSAQPSPSAQAPHPPDLHTPIQWGFLPLLTPDQGKLPGHPPPPSAPGNEQLRGFGPGWRSRGQGRGLWREVQGPSPACSEVQEAGVLEASSPPDVLSVGLRGWGGQRPGHSCPFLSSRSPAGWAVLPQASGWVAGRPSGPQVAGSQGQRSWSLPRPEAGQPRPPRRLGAQPTLPGRLCHPWVWQGSGVPGRACPSVSLCSLQLELPPSSVSPSVQRHDNSWPRWTEGWCRSELGCLGQCRASRSPRPWDSEPSFLAFHQAAAPPGAPAPPHPEPRGLFSLNRRLQLRPCWGPRLCRLPGPTRTHSGAEETPWAHARTLGC